jgi:hypothetical protein
MGYNTVVSDRIREYLLRFPQLEVEEKEMFRGVTFMVNNKMCVSVSGENLMCRFDPDLHEHVAAKNGFQPMIMKGKELKGYCYINPVGFASNKDFEYWVNLCLEYNERAKSSTKIKKRK